jgi:hypothetical protein
MSPFLRNYRLEPKTLENLHPKGGQALAAGIRDRRVTKFLAFSKPWAISINRASTKHASVRAFLSPSLLYQW